MKKTGKTTLFRGNRGIALSLFLIFLLGITAVIFTDSYESTLEGQRKQIYGAWHAAIYHTRSDAAEAVKSHAAVERAGNMLMCGSVLSPENLAVGGIGAAEGELQEVGNITLLDGNFPTEENEIAVEAACLDELGYSYELGQEITLKVLSGKAGTEIAEETHRFKLCGVVKNYSAHWNRETNMLISFFVTPQFCQKMPYTEYHVFAQLWDEYAKEAISLLPLAAENGAFLENSFTYLFYSDQSEPVTYRTVLQTAILLAGCLTIVLLMGNELNRRKKSLITLRILGAGKLQTARYFFKGKIRILLLSGGFGILCGLLLPYLVFSLLKGVLDQEICYEFSAASVSFMIALYSAGVLFSLLFTLIRLFQIPLRGDPVQQYTVKNIPRGRKRLSAKNLFSVLNAADRKKRLISVVLVFVSSVFLMISAYQAWADYIEYDRYCRYCPEDYSYGYLTAYHKPFFSMSEDSLKQVKSAYGVGEVQTFSVSDYYPLIFDGGYDEEYAEQSTAFLRNSAAFRDNAGSLPDTDVFGAAIGVSDNLFSAYFGEVDSEIAGDDILDKNEAILYLPDYSPRSDRTGDLEHIDVDLEYLEGSPNYLKILREEKIKAGDRVGIEVGGRVTYLKIAGIIRTFDVRKGKTSLSLHPLRPYSLICSEETYGEIFGESGYACVLVQGDDSRIAYQTDAELSKINTELFLSNHRLERMERSQQLMLQFLLSMMLSVFSFLATMLIRSGLAASEEDYQAGRYRLLYQLGMTRGEILRNLTRRSFYESIAGVLMAAAVLTGYRFLQERAVLLNYYADYVKPDFPVFFREVCGRCLQYTHWGFVLTSAAAVLVLNLLVLSVYNQRIVRGQASEKRM